MLKKMKMRKGFTLIEMLVVVGIITALLVIIGFVGPRLARGAKVSGWQGNIKELQTVLMVYANEHGEHYPDAPAAATDFADWAKTSEVGQYLSKTIENPFYKDTVVQISGSGAPAQIDGASAPTGATIIYTKTTDVSGLDHFEIQYCLGSTTPVSVKDSIQQ